jgi:DNA-binding IclR family transcriptional regulator
MSKAVAPKSRKEPPPKAPESAVRRARKVQSAETGMTVLKVLGQLGGAATLTRLATELGEHPAKVHRYLSSLVSSGFVEQEAATSRYLLGPEAVLLGLAAQRQSDVLRLAAAEIATLAETLDVSCFVAVMGNKGPVIVRWEEPVHAIVVNVRPGFVMPLLWSATGRAFVAFHRSDLVDALVTQELAAASEEQRRELPHRKAVDALVKTCRAHGCTWLQHQPLKGVGSLAAPIFDATGQAAAVIVAVGVAESFDVRPDGPNALALRRSAAAVSQRLGYVVKQAA